LWDLKQDKELSRLNAVGLPGLVAVDAKRQMLAKAGLDIEVWDLASWQIRLKLPAKDMGLVTISPDGRFLVFASMGRGELRVWDTKPIDEVVFSPPR
jgi:WD40 repeat protein